MPCRRVRASLRRSSMMRVGLLGRKVGMTQIYQENGTVRAGHGPGMRPMHRASGPDRGSRRLPCLATRLRRQEAKNATQAARGHAKKVNAEPERYIREIRQETPTEVAEGQTLTVELFNEIARVNVTGTSKGRGFAGVIKRHGFRGLRATHGVKRMHRHPGSSGPSADRPAPRRASASPAISVTSRSPFEPRSRAGRPHQ